MAENTEGRRSGDREKSEYTEKKKKTNKKVQNKR